MERTGTQFDAVYENTIATAEFRKAADILSGLWDKFRERATEFLDRRSIDEEGLDVATRAAAPRRSTPRRPRC